MNNSARALLATMTAPVVVIFCCITTYSKSSWLRTTNIYYLTFAMDQEFENYLGGWFWISVSHDLVMKMLAYMSVL